MRPERPRRDEMSAAPAEVPAKPPPPKPVKRRVPRYFDTEVSVDVTIDAEDLHDAGWHHEDECPAAPEEATTVVPPRMSLLDAVLSLHRQAHPTVGPITLCPKEPCRSLTLEQLRATVRE